MLKYPELAMNRKREVTTVYKGERRGWCDREDAQSFFLEMMMSTDGEEYERAECIYTQLIYGLDICSDDEEDDV